MRRVLLGLSLVATVALAACSSNAAPTSPSRSATPLASQAPAATTVSAAPPASAGAASAAGQTDTTWGRIWDSLPGGFPAIAGSTPTEAADGPASATLVVQGDAAKAIATSMQTALGVAGFRTEGLSGPLEDGSYVLDSAGTPAGCMVQVTAKPLGGVTTVTIMYGAVCAHG
ncbi:MAG: hypothetical protein QOE66_2585 [Chloroflexota bacterium]|nr:hypothetical protein [Chloroflexota bacterium]